jgi:hypothetical protein
VAAFPPESAVPPPELEGPPVAVLAPDADEASGIFEMTRSVFSPHADASNAMANVPYQPKTKTRR